jgi:hypothetical protein
VGSIGNDRNHDIMSENIKPNFRRNIKGKSTFITIQLEPAAASNFARKSELTSEVDALAMVSPKIPPPDCTRQVQSISLVFDRLYSQF